MGFVDYPHSQQSRKMESKFMADHRNGNGHSLVWNTYNTYAAHTSTFAALLSSQYPKLCHLHSHRARYPMHNAVG
jgi:hypothetical protein